MSGTMTTTKTIIVNDVCRDDQHIITRSQAKRITKIIGDSDAAVIDFKGVETIGRSFADQLFRVFSADKPMTKITVINANNHVLDAIAAAKANATN